MEIQTDHSFEELAAFAVNDPKTWLDIYILENGEGEPPQYNYTEKYHKSVGGFGMIEVDGDGGYEGGGDYADKVFAVAPVGIPVVNGRVEGAAFYVRYTGSYDSYNGTEWDSEPTFVAPKDVTVVQYHGVQ